VRAPDGLAGRLDDRPELAYALRTEQGKLKQGWNQTFAVQPFVKRARVSGPDTPETWEEGGPMNTLNSFDVGDIRTTAAIVAPHRSRTEPANPLDGADGAGRGDLPLGLDSHRYRCCGNGVVAPVSEWIGHRLRRAFDERAEVAA
jgi:hypothetical protein